MASSCPSGHDGGVVAWTLMLVRWQRTTDGEWPYRASAEGHGLAIRVNDFPAEPLYSLFVDDEHVTDLEDWPPVWVKPR
jgi:hypothetical protein